VVSVCVMGYDTRLCLKFCICLADIQSAVLSHLDITVILSVTWLLILWCVFHFWYTNHHLLVHGLYKILKYKKIKHFKK